MTCSTQPNIYGEIKILPISSIGSHVSIKRSHGKNRFKIPSQNLVSINPIRLRRILPINAAMPSSKTGIPIKECSFREFVPKESTDSICSVRE